MKPFALVAELAAFQQAAQKVTNTVLQSKEDREYFKCLVAENENEIVGIASFFLPTSHGRESRLYLDDLYV